MAPSEYTIQSAAAATPAALIELIDNAGDDYYQILGIDRRAGKDKMLKAYRTLVLRVHPDKCKEDCAREAFDKVAQAYQTLTDTAKRFTYDQKHPKAGVDMLWSSLAPPPVPKTPRVAKTQHDSTCPRYPLPEERAHNSAPQTKPVVEEKEHCTIQEAAEAAVCHDAGKRESETLWNAFCCACSGDHEFRPEEWNGPSAAFTEDLVGPLPNVRMESVRVLLLKEQLDEPVGLEMRYNKEICRYVVDGIKSTGAAARVPGSLQTGDQIISVNGAWNPKLIVQECQTALTLDFVVKRDMGMSEPVIFAA